MQRRKQKRHSAETKMRAVQEYLAGKGSLQTISQKYDIASKSHFRRMVLWYNSHGYFKDCPVGRGEIYMAKGRKTTQEERAEIVVFCIEHNKNYGLTVETYKVSYQQIYNWVRKYEEGGVDKLKDNRGRTKPAVLNIS